MNGACGDGCSGTTCWIAVGILICLLPLSGSNVFGQSRPTILSAVQANQTGGIHPIQRPAADRYDVVALRVEFQPDSSSFSTGDGTFGGTLFPGVDNPTIDPLPHDEDYFRAHLTFLENYIFRASDGRTTLATHIIPDIVQVSREMGSYAPVGLEASSDVELKKLAGLVQEAWSLASSLDSFDLPPGLDPERTAFVLFHAGIGRDVELLGTTLDKTPEDLPSLFFDADALVRLLGSFDLRVDGVPVSNTLVIPRTETRRGVDFIADEPFLAEISINGLLAASFLSYLGVPDLFDTATGESAIGPFGVMDGLGIFAYSGLLPPEPSAWTKLYLGWADVQTTDGTSGDQFVTLRHAGSDAANDLFLAPVSENEFFLVENRNRDPENDGLNLTVWRNGSYEQFNFDHGDSGFSSSSVADFPGGVVVDADNLDFALPGGRDPDGLKLEGGILIWHIDEQVLATGLEANAVNADPERRGVDLEEADGAQDVGFPGQGFFGPSFELGSPFDFFYQGNPTAVITPAGQEIRLYENRFGPDTYPSSTSSSGGSSFVDLSGFSVPGATMTFTFRSVSEKGLTPRDDISFTFEGVPGAFSLSSTLFPVTATGFDYAAFGRDSDGDGVLVWAQNGVTTGMYRSLFTAQPVLTGDGISIVAGDGFHVLGPDGSLQLTAPFPSGVVVNRTTTPLVALSDDRILVGAEDDAGAVLITNDFGTITTERLPEPLISLAVVDRLRTASIYASRAEISGLELSWTFDPISVGTPIQAAFSRNDTGVMGVVPDVDRGRMIILREDGDIRYVDAAAYETLGVNGTLNPYPVLADLDSDGRTDVIFSVGKTLLAVNVDGAVLNRFPIPLREQTGTQPLILRFQDDASPVIILAAIDGKIDAYDTGTRRHSVPGFPLSVASDLSGSPVIDGTSLSALTPTGRVSRWDFESNVEVIWGQFLGESNNSFIEIPEKPLGSISESAGGTGRVLTKGETYNWPNPIRDGVTWIRFKPRSRSDVEITIVDLAGQHIDTINVQSAPGAIASEVQWRTSAGSGIYMARVTATSETGQTETKLIKMAIIR